MMQYNYNIYAKPFAGNSTTGPTQQREYVYMHKNKTNHPISSNSRPSATANKTIDEGGVSIPPGISHDFDKV